MSILSSTKSGIKYTTLTLEDFKNHGFERGGYFLSKTYNGKTKFLREYSSYSNTSNTEHVYKEIYIYQCSINGKSYNIPITNLYSLKLVEDIFVTTEMKRLEKLKRKLYRHVFNHHAPTKCIACRT